MTQSLQTLWPDMTTPPPKQKRAVSTREIDEVTNIPTQRFIVQPRVSIHPDAIYMYGQVHWIVDRPPQTKSQLDNLKCNKTGAELSDKAKKKAKRAISYLLHAAPEKKVYNPKFNSWYRFKVNFITLSLSGRQQHTDTELKQGLLNQFLIEAKTKWNLQNYVWKAERQQNGNLHWHILTDTFIPWQELRDVWNRIQAKMGYLQAYRKQYNKDSPNSTDVHSLKNVKNVPAYVVKYMIKGHKTKHDTIHSTIRPKLRTIDTPAQTVSAGAKRYLLESTNCGRIWACSRSLSNITGAVSDIDNLILDEIERLSAAKGVRRVDKEHFTLLFFDFSQYDSEQLIILKSLLSEYLATIFPPTYYMPEF